MKKEEIIISNFYYPTNINQSRSISKTNYFSLLLLLLLLALLVISYKLF